jgi:hypothetical protein
VILADIWELSVLQAFHPDLDTLTVHCPVVGSQEGFSRSSSFKASVIGILLDAQPFHTGRQINVHEGPERKCVLLTCHISTRGMQHAYWHMLDSEHQIPGFPGEHPSDIE